MRKKVIKQTSPVPEIEIRQGREGINVVDVIHLHQKWAYRDRLDSIQIDKSKATTVAKAIDPEYQKVIDHNKFLEVENSRLTKVYQKSVNKTHELNDQNAKLVEALERISESINSKSFGVNTIGWYREQINIRIVEALQNTKNIEG